MGTGGTAGGSKVSVFWPGSVRLTRSQVLRALLCAIGSVPSAVLFLYVDGIPLSDAAIYIHVRALWAIISGFDDAKL